MNKDIVIAIFKNKILNKIIFRYVDFIFKSIEGKKDIEIYKWNEIIQRPVLLASYGYLVDLKRYYSNIDQQQYQKDIDDIDFYIMKSLIITMLSNRLDIVSYLLEEVVPTFDINITNLFQERQKSNYRNYLDGKYVKGDIMYYVVQSGSLQMVEYIDWYLKERCIGYNHSYTVFLYAFYMAPLGDNLSVCQWVHKVGLNSKLFTNINRSNICILYACANALKVGNLDIFKWLLTLCNEETIGTIAKKVWVDAAECNSIPLLDYMINHEIIKSSIVNPIEIINQAIKVANTNILLWMTQHHDIFQFNQYYFDEAIYSKNLKVIECIHNIIMNNQSTTTDTNQNRLTIPYKGIIMALVSGDIQLIEWLFRNRTTTVENWLSDRVRVDTFRSLSKEVKKFLLDNIPRESLPDLMLVNLRDAQVYHYLVEKQPNSITDDFIIDAAKFGDIITFKILQKKLIAIISEATTTLEERQTIYNIYHQAFYWSIFNKNMVFVKIICENTPASLLEFMANRNTSSIKLKLINYGHQPIYASIDSYDENIFSYLSLKIDFQYTTLHLDHTLSNGYLEPFILLYKKGIKCSIKGLRECIRNKHIHIQKYLDSNNLIDSILNSEDLEILKNKQLNK